MCLCLWDGGVCAVCCDCEIVQREIGKRVCAVCGHCKMVRIIPKRLACGIDVK